MPYVLTVDQRASRRGPDRVDDVLGRLNTGVRAVLSFERTAGDEFQGVLDDPAHNVYPTAEAADGRDEVLIGSEAAFWEDVDCGF